jgi:sensor histidine kinase YesM
MAKYWTNLVLLSYAVISVLCIVQSQFQMFYAFTLLTFVLLVFINLEKFESFKLLGLAAKLKASIAEAEVTKAEFEQLSQEFKEKTQELERLIKQNHSIALALSL